jgi:hypothetical protein
LCDTIFAASRIKYFRELSLGGETWYEKEKKEKEGLLDALQALLPGETLLWDSSPLLYNFYCEHRGFDLRLTPEELDANVVIIPLRTSLRTCLFRIQQRNPEYQAANPEEVAFVTRVHELLVEP